MIAQSYEDFEIIATDDGSTDGTPKIIREIDDSRIDFQALESNTGISDAMNATLARASGEYIAILNSDDYALPDRLRSQVEFLDNHPEIDAVFGMPKMIGEDGTPTRTAWGFLLPGDFSRATWLRHFFINCNCLCAPTAMIRRSAYLRTGAYDPRLINLQDFDMWVRMLIDGSNFWVSNDEVTAFRIRDGAKNASAFRRDSQLRSLYEFSRILRWYRTLDTETLERVFAPEIESGTISIAGKQTESWLSELALNIGFSAHQLFALDTLFETAKCQEDYKRLSHVMGQTDVFRYWTERELREVVQAKDQEILSKEKEIARLRSPIKKLMRSFRRKIRGKYSLTDQQEKDWP